MQTGGTTYVIDKENNDVGCSGASSRTVQPEHRNGKHCEAAKDGHFPLLHRRVTVVSYAWLSRSTHAGYIYGCDTLGIQL